MFIRRLGLPERYLVCKSKDKKPHTKKINAKFLVKHNPNAQGYIYLCNKLNLPKSFIGKKVRLILEVCDD